MTRWTILVAMVLMAVGVVAGCGGKPAAPAAKDEGKPATPEQLVEVWDQLVAAPQDKLNFQLAHAVAQDISTRGAEGIVPLLKKIDVEKPTPQAVVLTLNVLRDQIKPEHEALLTELCGPSHSIVTRLIVIDLLGGIATDTVTAKMAELEKDPDLLISVAAYLARLHLGDDAYVARLKGYWDNPKVHDASRQEMMRRLPEAAAAPAIEQLCATLAHPDWDSDVRKRVISMLGMLPDPRALAALKLAVDNSPEPEMHEFALKAEQAIQARIDSGATYQEVEVGPDGVRKVTTPLSAAPAATTGSAPAAAAAPAPSEAPAK